MSTVQDLKNQIEQLTGYTLNTTGSGNRNSVSTPNFTGRAATAPSGTIPTFGIVPGGVIQSNQILNIINALNGTNVDTIIISGSFLTSGSNVLDGNLSLPFIQDGNYLFVTGGLVKGTTVTNTGTASFAISSSYAQTADLALTASYFSGSISNAISASYALTASYALNVPTQSVSSSYAATSSLPLLGIVTASALASTITFTKGDQTTFDIVIAQSGSVQTASYAIFAENAGTSSIATTASYALTASYVMNMPTASISASYALSASHADTASIANIQYVTNSIVPLGQIQVLDYSDSVATTYVNGLLTFVFGTPAAPSALAASLSGFATDRFNQVTDNYTVNGSWNNGGYTLISASLYESNTLLTEIGTGTSISYNTTTSGSHTYKLTYTASNPLDSSIYMTSTTTTGTLSKTNPGSPTISATPTIQLGAASNQFEQGATGSILFTSASGASNGWVFNYETSNVQSPYTITGSLTGSASIPLTAVSYYSSSGINGSDNNPALTTTTTTTTTYSKIRSLRSGATLTSSYSQAQLEVLSNWDTSLGGTVGSIRKGTLNPTGQAVTINWTGSLYQYIVYDSAYANLTSITSAGFNVIGSFTLTTAGSYKVYRSTALQAGYDGTSVTYTLI